MDFMESVFLLLRRSLFCSYLVRSDSQHFFFQETLIIFKGSVTKNFGFQILLLKNAKKCIFPPCNPRILTICMVYICSKIFF